MNRSEASGDMVAIRGRVGILIEEVSIQIWCIAGQCVTVITFEKLCEKCSVVYCYIKSAVKNCVENIKIHCLTSHMLFSKL